MYKIYLNSEEIEFDGVISGKIFNPFFLDYSNYSFPFNIILTKKNKKIIDYVYLVEKSESELVQYECKIELPREVIVGKATFLKFNNNSAELTFTENKDFWSDMKSLTLNDLNLNLFRNLSYDKYTRETTNYVYAPIYNENFANGFKYANIEFNPIINEVFPVASDSTLTYNNRRIYIPFPKLHILVKKIFEYFDYKVAYNGLEQDVYFSKMLLYYNYTPFYFKWILDSQLETNEFIANITDDNNDVIITTGDVTTFITGEIIMITQLTSVPELNNKTFEIEVIDNQNFKLLGINFDEISSYVSSGRVDNVKLTINQTKDPYQDVFPNITLLSFIKQIQKIKPCGFFIDEKTKTVRIELFDDMLTSIENTNITNITGKINDNTPNEYDGYIVKYLDDSTDELTSENFKDLSNVEFGDPVATFNDLPAIGNRFEVRLVIDLQIYYQYNTGIDANNSSWVTFSAVKQQATQDGDNQLLYEIEMSPPNMIKTSVLGITGSVKMIHIKQAVNNYFSESITESPFRFFIYLGEQKVIGTSETWPLSTNLYGDHEGSSIDSNEQLDLMKIDESTGFYELVLKKFINWSINERKDVKAQVNWTNNTVFNIDFSKKFKNLYTNYLIKMIPYKYDFAKKITEWEQTELVKI